MSSTQLISTPPGPLVSIRVARVLVAVGCFIAALCLFYGLSAWYAAGRAPAARTLGPTITGIVVLATSFIFLIFARQQQVAYAFRLANADAPWTWRPEWRGSAIRCSERHGFWIVGVLALPWSIGCTIVLVMLWLSFSGDDRELELMVFTCMALVVGLGLMWAAFKTDRARRKFGIPHFLPTTVPGEIGGQLLGSIEVPAPIELLDGHQAELTLRCVLLENISDNRTSETTVWESTQLLDAAGLRQSAGRTSLPVEFDIPCGVPESSWVDVRKRDYLEWRLLASAKTDGLDFNTCFKVPVFLTAETRRHHGNSSLARKPVASEARLATGPAQADPLPAKALLAGSEGDVIKAFSVRNQDRSIPIDAERKQWLRRHAPDALVARDRSWFVEESIYLAEMLVLALAGLIGLFFLGWSAEASLICLLLGVLTRTLGDAIKLLIARPAILAMARDLNQRQHVWAIVDALLNKEHSYSYGEKHQWKPGQAVYSELLLVPISVLLLALAADLYRPEVWAALLDDRLWLELTALMILSQLAGAVWTAWRHSGPLKPGETIVFKAGPRGIGMFLLSLLVFGLGSFAFGALGTLLTTQFCLLLVSGFGIWGLHINAQQSRFLSDWLTRGEPAVGDG